MGNRLPDGIVNIRGKQYETVALRVHKFREAKPTLSLVTEVLHRDVDCVVMKATIVDEQGRVLATGHAEEFRKASEINRTSALENCETSAIGRALAAYGFGGTEFASADEVARAISGQKGEAVQSVRISATEEAWKMLQPEVQDYLRKVAVEVTGAMPDAHKALELLEMAALDADSKAGLWHLLDSATRSGIKKAAMKEAA